MGEHMTESAQGVPMPPVHCFGCGKEEPSSTHLALCEDLHRRMVEPLVFNRECATCGTTWSADVEECPNGPHGCTSPCNHQDSGECAAEAAGVGALEPVDDNAAGSSRCPGRRDGHSEARAEFARLAQHLADHLEPWWRCVHPPRPMGVTMEIHVCRDCELERAEVGVALAESLLNGQAGVRTPPTQQADA